MDNLVVLFVFPIFLTLMFTACILVKLSSCYWFKSFNMLNKIVVFNYPRQRLWDWNFYLVFSCKISQSNICASSYMFTVNIRIFSFFFLFISNDIAWRDMQTIKLLLSCRNGCLLRSLLLMLLLVPSFSSSSFLFFFLFYLCCVWINSISFTIPIVYVFLYCVYIMDVDGYKSIKPTIYDFDKFT